MRTKSRATVRSATDDLIAREPFEPVGKTGGLFFVGSVSRLIQARLTDYRDSVDSVQRFEPQLLRYRLQVKVRLLRANLITLNLKEASDWIGDGSTAARGVGYD